MNAVISISSPFTGMEASKPSSGNTSNPQISLPASPSSVHSADLHQSLPFSLTQGYLHNFSNTHSISPLFASLNPPSSPRTLNSTQRPHRLAGQAYTEHPEGAPPNSSSHSTNGHDTKVHDRLQQIAFKVDQMQEQVLKRVLEAFTLMRRELHELILVADSTEAWSGEVHDGLIFTDEGSKSRATSPPSPLHQPSLEAGDSQEPTEDDARGSDVAGFTLPYV